MWANLGQWPDYDPFSLRWHSCLTTKFITDIPFILFLSIGLYILMPEPDREGAIK